jgi:hypothetical protein
MSSFSKDFLSKHGPKPTSEVVIVKSFVKTDVFVQLSDLWYKEIIALFPDAVKTLGPATFRHISRLFIQRRIEDVVFKETAYKPIAVNRVPLPHDVRIPQPLWDVLAAIGVVEEPQANKAYVPALIEPPGQHHTDYDENYMSAILACTGQDWPTSWDEAVKEIEARRTAAAGQDTGAQITAEEAESLEREAEELTAMFRELSGRQEDHTTARYIHKGHLYTIPKSDQTRFLVGKVSEEDIDDYFSVFKPSSSINFKSFTHIDEVRAEIFKNKNKRQRYKEQEATSYVPYAVIADEPFEGQGAYGRNFGWSPEMWSAYSRFVSMVSSNALFSLSMPNEKTGSMASVLPIKKMEGNRIYSYGPSLDVPPAEYGLAVIIQTAYWDPPERRGWVSNWCVKSEVTSIVNRLRLDWIHASFKLPIPSTHTAYTR